MSEEVNIKNMVKSSSTGDGVIPLKDIENINLVNFSDISEKVEKIENVKEYEYPYTKPVKYFISYAKLDILQRNNDFSYRYFNKII